MSDKQTVGAVGSPTHSRPHLTERRNEIRLTRHTGLQSAGYRPFRSFDVELTPELHLLELLMVVMGGTLRQHRGLTPTRAAHRVLELADRCAQAEGTFTLLWHNSSLTGEWIPWAHMYRKIVGELPQRAIG